MKKQILAVALVATMGATVTGCCDSTKTEKTEQITKTMNAETLYVKKYTNADYYKDGEFQPKVALQAYEEMLAHYGLKLSEFQRENLWITDFSIGDFENVGMAGFFWVNDAKANYFAHEIFLLPNQMILEHKHLPTEFAAKMESWVVKKGFCYNFAVGDATPNSPKLPKSQEGHTTAQSFVKQNIDEIVHLKEIETPHFLFAGDGGAVVMEFASYHDGSGLRFTNPKAVFTSAMAKDL